MKKFKLSWIDANGTHCSDTSYAYDRQQVMHAFMYSHDGCKILSCIED